MKRLKYLSVIAHDIGLVLEFLGIASLLPFAVLVIFREWGMILPMASAPFTFFVVGYLLTRVTAAAETIPPVSVTIVAVALSWLAIALIGGLPYVLGHGMSYTDSVVEAMSGWTGSGMTMMTSLDTAPYTLLFWRSFTQWIGGIGIIAFGISLRRKTRLTLFRLYRSEGRTEEMMPNVVSTGRRMWLIYLFLTFAFTGLIMLSGLPLWDSLNLVMVAIATGGFTIHDAGVSFYNNPVLELLLIPVMFAGAFPFKVYFLMYHGKVLAMFRDSTVQAMFLIASIGSAVVSLDLCILNNFPAEQAVREGVFSVVSGFTTCGFQNTSVHSWATVPIAVVTMLMLIGGAMGSTCGGIKVNRIVLAFAGIRWWFRRFFVSSKVIIPLRFEGRTLSRELSDFEISRNMLTIVLYVLTVFSATVLVLHLYITTFRLEEVVFDVVSGLANVGMSTGYFSSASPFPIKIVFIVLMWLGRLEIMPALIMVLGLVKGFEATMTK